MGNFIIIFVCSLIELYRLYQKNKGMLWDTFITIGYVKKIMLEPASPTKCKTNFDELYEMVNTRRCFIFCIDEYDAIISKFNSVTHLNFETLDNEFDMENINNKLKEYDDEINHLIIIETGHRFYELV